jgi:hypothetical protein
LAGLGTVSLHKDGTLSGEQRSTIMRMIDAGPPPDGGKKPLQHARFKLSGEYELRPDHTGHASILFHPYQGNQILAPNLKGEFAIIYRGPTSKPTQLWIISSKTTKLTGRDVGEVFEMVSGEAVAMR